MSLERRPLIWPVQLVILACALALSIAGGWFGFLFAGFWGCEGSPALYDSPSDSFICADPLRQFVAPVEVALVLLVALAPLVGAVMTSRGRGARWLLGGIVLATLAFASILALATGQQSVTS